MAREKLKDFLNKKGVSSDSISYVRKDGKDGLGVDPSTNEELVDLINENSGLLGDYISFLTSEEKNEFQIKPGNSEAAPSKRGDALDIADNQGAEKIFVEQGTVLKSKLNEYSNSRYFDDAGAPLADIIDKTGAQSSHNLLKDIEGRSINRHGKTLVNPNGENNDVVQSINKVFLNNNRFANVGSESNKSFTDLPQDISEFESQSKSNNHGTLTLQNTFGKYDKEKTIVSFQELKEIGKSLLLSSSGFKENILAGSKVVNEYSGFEKMDVGEARAQNTDDFPRDRTGKSLRDGSGEYFNRDPEAKNSKTYGATYNTEMHFQGKNLDLLNIEAITSMYALKKISQDFFKDFLDKLRVQDRSTLVSDAEKVITKKASVDIGTYMLGRSRHMSSVRLDFGIFNKLLTNTIYPYGEAVNRGLEVIFTDDLSNKIDDSLESTIRNKNKNIVQSSGFWLAVSRSILKSFDQIVSKYSDDAFGISDENQLFLIYKDIIESNKFVQFFNTMAAIGDISLSSTDGERTKVPNPGEPGNTNGRSLDNLPDEKAYAPGRSRKSNGRYASELSWNQDATPSMYILPANIIRAATKLNNQYDGTSPARGMLGSKLVENTYFGIDVDGSYNRIPKEVVKQLEDKLDAEYVPFYIQDLRTNEIISFNAFLSTLTDNIQSSHNGIKGYGRLDDVQIYSSTTRTVSVGFTLMATNREDFDSMWFKINKLTTLLYPQWTPGSMVSTDNSSKFYQPFSQVVGASPLVRLRVGDVIKSNYSRFGLARTFGIGDGGVTTAPTESTPAGNTASIAGAIGSLGGGSVSQIGNVIQDVALKLWLAVFGSPLSIGDLIFNSIPTPQSNFKKIAKNMGRDVALKSLSSFLINGFANPLAVNDIVNQLKDPNRILSGDRISRIRDWANKRIESLSGLEQSLRLEEGLEIFDADDNASAGILKMMILKPNMINGYYSPDTKKTYLLPRRLRVRVVGSGTGIEGMPEFASGYRIKIVDINAPSDLIGKHLNVIHQDILPDPSALFSSSIMGLTLYATDPVGSIGDALTGVFDDTIISTGLPAEAIDLIRILYASNSNVFMQPGINPFTRAYETTAGRGLAGVIDGINFNWLENFPWEVDYNSRAPMGCKISFSLKVIHDLPPGLDHTGYNRAPIYNVGQIMKNVAGDVYSDDGKTAEFNFKNGTDRRYKISRRGK